MKFKYINSLTSASLTGKSTLLLKLLQHIDMFDYRVERAVLFYYNASPIYEEMGDVLRSQGVEFEKQRYGETPLTIEALNELRKSDTGDGVTLLLFDDCSRLVETDASFNHLIHLARHSGLLCILLVHGLVYQRPQARTMVCNKKKAN